MAKPLENITLVFKRVYDSKFFGNLQKLRNLKTRKPEATYEPMRPGYFSTGPKGGAAATRTGPGPGEGGVGNPHHDPSTGKFTYGTGGKQTTENRRRQHRIIRNPVKRLADIAPQYVKKIEDYMKKYGVDPTKIQSNIEEVWLRAQHHPDFENWMEWYNDAKKFNTDVAKHYGKHADVVTAITAALSPQTSWERNQQFTLQAMDALKKAETMKIQIKPAIAAKWLSLDQNSGSKQIRKNALNVANYNGIDTRYQGHDFTKGTYNALDLPADVAARAIPNLPRASGRYNIAKVIRLYQGENPEYVLGGNKVRSFNNNMSDPTRNDWATIDAHASRMMFGFNLPDKIVEKVLKGPQAGELKGAGSYPYLVDQIQQVAAKYGVLANQVQAATWMQWRLDHPKEERRKFTNEYNRRNY